MPWQVVKGLSFAIDLPAVLTEAGGFSLNMRVDRRQPIPPFSISKL
jgi:hypothetical protein